ncbi:hypothetical protein ACFL3E_02520, partial [Patescibacteria group bacterium]
YVIEHMLPEDVWQTLKESHRVLKVGGRIAIRTPLENYRFYRSFSHIKPYPPESIKHYLSTKPQKQRI